MSWTRRIVALLATAGLVAAEESQTTPQTTLRGVVNGVSFQSAPAAVAQGGILAVIGEGLAAEHTVADTSPLPVSLEDPTVEVLINDVAAPLFFVSPTQVNAQVPWNTETGWAEVVVRRDGMDSIAMPVIVTDASPNLIRHEGSSAPIAQSATPSEETTSTDGSASTTESGPLTLQLGSPGSPPTATGTVLDPAAAISGGDSITLFAAGIGATTPEITAGSAGTADTTYAFVNDQRAHLGGVPVEDLSVEVSTDLVGIYKMTFTVPDLAESTEVFRWTAGGQGTSAVLGPINTPTARYMAIPDDVDSVQRIDMADLNPYYVALTGRLDPDEGCYSGVQLLDFRRDTTTALSDCILPSYPNAPNPTQQYRPFELGLESPVFAALLVPPEDTSGSTTGDEAASGVTDRLLLIDSAAGTTETVTLDSGVDRLLLGEQGSRSFRLERPDGTGMRDVVDHSGTVVDESQGWLPLPDPLEVDDLTRSVAQGSASFPGGYRVRFLGPESADEIANSKAILFDISGTAIAKVSFPEGWAPIQPPRRLNPQGNPVGGASMAPVMPGFQGDTTAYIVVRKTDGTADGVVAFQVEIPEESEAESTEASSADSQEEDGNAVATMTATAISFPQGVFAANCTVQVRWQRIPLTRTLAIAGSDEALSTYSEPRDNQICTSDRLVLFRPDSSEFEVISVTGESDVAQKLDVNAKGTVSGYLYFGDGARSQAFLSPETLHVFDGATKTFSRIAMPEGVGIMVNFLTQNISGSGRVVALATAGPLRTNPRTGASMQPFPGNRGLLVVNLPEGTINHLDLPEGFQRVIPGSFPLVREGRRGFGVLAMIGRAYANVRYPNAGPGTPGGSAIVTWDLATGTATQIPMPEGGFAAVQAIVPRQRGAGGGGGNQTPFVWDLKPKSGSFAFGVYDSGGDIISVGVVSP